MRILIVHNRKSGYGSDAIFEFERALVRAGDECVMRLLYDKAYDSLAYADAEEYDVVVVSGGDGTVTNALSYLAFRDVPTCIFPSGTANLFAANLGNATEPAALASACRAGRTAFLDLVKVTWTCTDGTSGLSGSALMSGSGFDARIMHAAIPHKNSLGEAAYFAAVLSDRRPEVIHFSIEVDGQVIERDGISCLVANNAMLQGDVQIVPGCTMDDGLLDVIIVETENAMKLIRPLMRGLIDHKGNKIGRPYVESFQGKRVKVVPDHPVQMEIDGDVVEREVVSWEAEAIPGAARLIVDDFSRYAPEEP